MSSIRGILYARAKSSSTRKGGKMMTEMTLAVVPNKIRARSRRLRHVIHEQGEPSSSFFGVSVGVGGVVVAHRRSSLDGALAK